jgi:hypothetical protein
MQIRWISHFGRGPKTRSSPAVDRRKVQRPQAVPYISGYKCCKIKFNQRRDRRLRWGSHHVEDQRLEVRPQELPGASVWAPWKAFRQSMGTASTGGVGAPMTIKTGLLHTPQALSVPGGIQKRATFK